MFLFLRGRTCAHFLLRACAGRVTFLATFCFVYPPYEVAMPSETNSAKERQNVRNALSRALRALETPEEKLVRREIRNEKDRIRRRKAKTKQKQVTKKRIFLFEKPLNVPNLFIRLFLRITVPGAFIIEKSYYYCFLTLTVFCSHTKHAWNSCNYREHASLTLLFCAIRAHH